MVIKKYLQALLFDWRLARAKRKATRHANLYGKKFLVLVFGGKPVVVSMQGIKSLIRQHRFKRGFTAQQAEKIAIFTAMPHKEGGHNVSDR